MKSLIRHIIGKTYKPLLQRYLASPRNYRYQGITVLVPAGVFHPGFFFSTKILLRYISRLPLHGKKFLEPGCGTGLISLYAARNGALVTATDINPQAINAVIANGNLNKLPLKAIQSDLFEAIPEEHFDIIAINPPYYKKNPSTAAEFAWYCGDRGQYFDALFRHLLAYSHPGTSILMILFEGCDESMIRELATANGFRLSLMETHRNWLEKNFIYKIERTECSFQQAI